MIEIFYAPFYIGISDANLFLFNVVDFIVFSNSSFITVARWTYYQGEFGVSINSVVDLWYFMVDSDRNFKWSTSIDYLNDYEETQSLYEYNNTLYVSIVTSKYYYCLTTLDYNNGFSQNYKIQKI